MSQNTITAEMSEDHEGVLVVMYNRPPVNALGIAHIDALSTLFSNVSTEFPDARCMVLTGAGKAFSAGADVKELSVRTTETQLARSVISRGMFDALRRCSIPVIAAVNGHALGAGAAMVGCADIIIASENAKFGLPEVLVGAMGGTRHMARFAPAKVMRYMALTGRQVDAAYLERFGGIQEVTTLENLMPTALIMAAEIAQNSPAISGLMKESINLTEDMPLTEGYRVEQLFTTLASSMPDAAEASKAFIEKRKPVWK